MLRDSPNEFGLPIGDNGFVELYCNECDCRRVFLKVILNDKNVANIVYGWETIAFYRKAFKGFSDKDLKELKGPELDLFQYQSELAPMVFKMFKKLLFADANYMKRIEKHYAIFKSNLKKSKSFQRRF